MCCSKVYQQVPTPAYKQPLLHELIQLARVLRLQGKTKANILKEVIHQKSQMSVLQKADDNCLMGQVKEDVFSKLVFSANTTKPSGEPSNQDIEIGSDLFHAVMFCPAMIFKTYTFIDRLLSNESSRTIILTFTQLFQSGALKDRASFTLAKQFYQVFATTLDLQYGNILLVTSNTAQWKGMIRNDWPFLGNNTDAVQNCLEESNCDIFQKITENLGMMLPFHQN